MATRYIKYDVGERYARREACTLAYALTIARGEAQDGWPTDVRVVSEDRVTISVRGEEG